MRGDGNSGSVLCRKMIVQRVHTGNMIRMNVRQHDLANIAAARNQIVDRLGQFLLFIFVRDPGSITRISGDV